jgi:hypothetical protein
MKICYKNIKLCGIYIENLYQKCYNARIQYVEGTKEFIRYSVPWKGRYFYESRGCTETIKCSKREDYPAEK